MTLEYTYFRVTESRRLEKTSVYEVTSKKGPLLGTIRWYGSWRAYCFFPEVDCVWSAGCLAEIQQALGVVNAKREEARRGQQP